MKFLPLIEQYVKVTCIKFQFNWIIRRRVMIFLRFASASNFVAKFTAIQTIPSGPTRNEIRSRDVCLNLQVPPAGLVAPDGHVMRAPPMAKCRHFSNSINDNLQVKTVGFCFNANISSVERPRSWLVRRRTGRCGHRERRLIEFRPFRPPPIWNWDSILLQLDFMAGSSTTANLFLLQKIQIYSRFVVKWPKVSMATLWASISWFVPVSHRCVRVARRAWWHVDEKIHWNQLINVLILSINFRILFGKK